MERRSRSISCWPISPTPRARPSTDGWACSPRACCAAAGSWPSSPACRHTADGVLVDATGGIVASAQNADLLYLQHIVIPAQPLRPPRATDAAAHQAPDLSTVHEVAHVDLLVFARPRTGNTHAESGMAAAGDATAGVPSSVVVAGASSGVRR